MLRNRLALIVLCLAQVLSSCEKRTLEPLAPETSKPDKEDEKPDTPHPDKEKITLTPDNNGRLVIDGSTQQFDCNTIILIKGGQYAGITIRNLHGKDGCPIFVQNEGLVEFVGFRNTLSIIDVSHVIISGNGTHEIDKGFLFRDNEYRSIELSGDINYFTIQHMAFKNIGNYVISYNDQKAFDGSAKSHSTAIRFKYLKAENCGPLINFGGGIDGANIKGLVRGLEVAFVEVLNSPRPRNVVYVGMVEDYDIHDNVFSNINANENNHNAMFHLVGNGKFYNNRITSHQGNAIRAWAVTIGTSPKEIHIFNNIVVNSRKYSAFEAQSFEHHMIPQKTTYSNVKVYHNTCGNLNQSKDWYGVVLDAYRLFGGTCEVYNNLGFSFPAPHPKSAIISYMSIESGKLKEENNLYFANAALAGIQSETKFNLSSSSKAVGTGIQSNLSYDIYGLRRNATSPSVGAVE